VLLRQHITIALYYCDCCITRGANLTVLVVRVLLRQQITIARDFAKGFLQFFYFKKKGGERGRQKEDVGVGGSSNLKSAM
jgi:hypothetical protein